MRRRDLPVNQASHEVRLGGLRDGERGRVKSLHWRAAGSDGLGAVFVGGRGRRDRPGSE